MGNNGLNTIMGARNGARTNRQKSDFYATDPKTVNLFLDTIEKDNIILNNKLLEPCSGMNHIVNVLKERGYNVYSMDINDYGCQDRICDFLEFQCNEFKDYSIITNPPYNLQNEVIEKALDIVQEGKYVIMYLKVQFLEGIKRHNEIFKDNNPKYVYVHVTRQTVARDGDFETYGGHANTICFIWCIWEKGFKGDTVLRRIPEDK